MKSFVRFSHALFIFVLMGVLLAAYSEQLFKHEIPCPLCMLQRIAMIGIGCGLVMNLRFGIQIRYYAFALASAFIGGAVSLRQICLHICPGFPIFGIPVFGLNLYTWAFLVFCCSTAALIVLLFLFRTDQKKKQRMNLFEYLAFILLVGLTVANIATTYYQCGFSSCKDVPWPQPKGTIMDMDQMSPPS